MVGPIDGRTVVLFRFDERAASIRPLDRMDNVFELAPFMSMPAVVPGALGGYAREWAPDDAMSTTEKVAGSTRLTRDLTVEAIVPAEAFAANGTYVLLQRGKGGGAPQHRILFSFRVVTSGGARSLLLTWERSGGTMATVSSTPFTPPAPGWIYLWATRRWANPNLVEVTYGMNDQVLATVTSGHGDIEDGDGGQVFVGSIDGTAGFPEVATIDLLRLSGEVRAPEELRQIYRRLFVYPDLGYRALVQLVPEAIDGQRVWSDDPASLVQRELMVEGAALGVAWALMDELLEDFLPDRAHRALYRWEELHGLAPLPLETFAERRARVIGFLSREFGYTRASIRELVAPLLGLDESQVEIIERSNRFADALSSASIADHWFVEENAGVVTGSVSGLELELPTGEAAGWTAAARTAVAVRTSLLEGAECEVLAQLVSLTDFDDPALATGIFVWNQITGDAHQLLVSDDGGVLMLESRIVTAAGVTSASYAIPDSPITPFYLRYKANADGTADVGWNTTGVEGPWTAIAEGVQTVDDPHWAGLCIIVSAAPANDIVAKWGDFRTWCPLARQVFEWFVYRDPAIGAASWDTAGAQLVIEKTQMAGTTGLVIEQTEILCDTDGHVMDRDLMGA